MRIESVDTKRLPMTRARRLISPPVFRDPEQTRIASLIYLISLTLLAASILAAISSQLFGYYRPASALIIGAGGVLGVLGLTRRGHLRYASLLLLLMFLGVLNYLLYVGDGIHDIAAIAYPAIIIIAGLLLDKRTYAIYTLLAILSLQGIVFCEMEGFVTNKFGGLTSYADAVYASVILLVTTISARLLSDNITGNIARARSSQHALAENNRELQREIAERERAEQERERLLTRVQEQAQQVQQIMDTVPEGVLLLDADLRVQSVNPPAREYLSILAGGQGDDTLTYLGERAIKELLTSPPRGLWHEVEVKGPPRRLFEVIARPIESGPTPDGWVLVIRDVTKKKEIQRRAQQQERLAAVGQLAAGIAHDFNNNLAVITLYAQTVQRAPNLSAEDFERLATVTQQARRAANLTEQILDFSRRSVLEQRPVDLAPFLKELAKLLERTLEESVQVKLRIGPSECMVRADPSRMQQVLMNLAINARDAMPDGGELRLNLGRTWVRPDESPPLPGMAAGEWIELTVSDTGVGIPSDVLPRIFEPFFTTKAPGEGTGLGLAQVWGIVQQHEGHIDVVSKAEEGTTFTLYLPALQVSRPETLAHETSALPQGQGETILVVEDYAVTREALVDSLEMLNYRVLAATNGREALEVFEQDQDQIELVVSDAVMPEMGGRALLHALRQRNSGIKMVMLTGHPLGRKLDDLRALGMSAWLPKPLNLDQLAQAVAQALEGNSCAGETT